MRNLTAHRLNSPATRSPVSWLQRLEELASLVARPTLLPTGMQGRGASVVLCLLLASAVVLGLSQSQCYAGNTLASLEEELWFIVQNVKPSVVTVTSQYDARTIMDLDSAFERLQFFVDVRNPIVRRNVGSGIVFDKDIIVTSGTVVRPAKDVIVTFEDGRSYSAEVLGTDMNANVCVLRAEGLNVKPIPVGSSKNVRTGSLVILMGNSFGKLPTVALGTVSGSQKVARVQGKREIIQMTGPVHPGNAGGAVLNTKGELVAMVVGRLVRAQVGGSDPGSPGGEQVGSVLPTSGGTVGFALPVEEIRKVVDEVLKNGCVSTGFLGVRIQDYGAGGTITRLGLSSAPGVEIAEVVPDSPADKAGLMSGDILSEFDGEAVLEAAQLAQMVATTRPGEKVKVSFWRGSKRFSAQITIGVAKPQRSKSPVPPDLRRQFPAVRVPQRVLTSEN
ncbi:MAG: trypsin-like peptidase domain-containing protein [Candidatus Eiseniibacteriota bacterium]|nr:MAG: trypsin-like peptidase domain-containing protein [Candidatus Eisenbacteria bacterium]